MGGGRRSKRPDLGLTIAVRSILDRRNDIGERQMFGGIAFLVSGNMAVGILGDVLMVRVGPNNYEAALADPWARVMDFTGRPLRGFVYVDPEGTRERRSLARWVERGVSFAASLPAK